MSVRGQQFLISSSTNTVKRTQLISLIIWTSGGLFSTSSRAVYGIGLRPLACWNCGFESRRGFECLPLPNFVDRQVVVSATGRSLVQRSPTECGVSMCDLDTSKMRRSRP
jgi:hypothetical protein